MKQWFTGKFRGHYRGRPSEASLHSPYRGAPHFRIEVYEALVSDIALGPLVPDPPPPEIKKSEETNENPPSAAEPAAPPQPSEIDAHHKPEGPALHQSHISKVHLVDPVRRGQMVRSTAHDVLMSGFQLSHPAESSQGTLGHIEGTISGWYRPPPPSPEVEEFPPLKGPPPVGWQTTVPEQEVPEQGGSGASRRRTAQRSAQRKSDSQLESEEALDAVLSEEAPSVEYPFFSIGAGITLLLAFFATPFAAVLFGLTFLLSYGVRRWLLGVVPDVSGVRVLALFLGSTQILVAALLIAHSETVGCVALSPLPLIWLLGAQMTASFLPRPLPFLLTTAGFAAVLLQSYASWAPPSCGAETAPAPTAETTETAPAASEAEPAAPRH